jgi:hypothetical protein
MSALYPTLTDRAVRSHPAVRGDRAGERLRMLLAALVAAAIALAISVEMPTPGAGSVAEVLGAMIGVVGVVALMLSTRYTVTLTLLTLYLGLLDGPVKLLTGSKYASGFRDVLMISIGLGMLMRLSRKGEPVRMPALSGWVFAFAAVVLVEALNPSTGGFVKSIAGYRQQLEFVPLFFFGYVIVRNKQRFRQLFLILGVIALANGMVSAVQWRLSPSALAGWGPGYSERITGRGGRTYRSEGVAHPRPPGLGSDAGFGGGIGVIALPGLIALLTAGRMRRRWPVLLCCLGALIAIATCASRSSVVNLVVELAAFAALAVLVRVRLSRALSGLVMVAAMIALVVAGLIAVDGAGIFKRQISLGHVASAVSAEATGEEREEGEQGGGDAKIAHLSQIPGDIVHEPFGLGLGTAGAVAGFGGKVAKTIEQEKVSGGSAYNLLVVELGLPGLFLWVGLTVSVLMLALTRLKQIADPELRIYLIAIVSAFVALTVQGFAGPTLAVTPPGAFLWFAPGVIAYWLAGPGRKTVARSIPWRAAITHPAPAT